MPFGFDLWIEMRITKVRMSGSIPDQIRVSHIPSLNLLPVCRLRYPINIFSHRKFAQIISRYSIAMNRSKKLTLNAPYSKISKVLWENKKLNFEKQKQNLQLQTRVQHLHEKSNQPHATYATKIEQKYEKLIAKVKEQSKWIKETSLMIEERKYEQLRNEVNRLESKLNVVTDKAKQGEKKLRRFCKKAKKIDDCSNLQPPEQPNHQPSPFYQLQNQKAEMQFLIKSKTSYLFQIEQRNKELNKEIIELLMIKNKLKGEVKEWRENDSSLSLCRPIPEFASKPAQC